MKTLPNDIELERSILGYCLIDQEAFLYCVSSVTVDYFCHPFYAGLWQAMVAVHESGVEMDIVAVRHKLADFIKEPPQELRVKLMAVSSSLTNAKVENMVPFARNLMVQRRFIKLCGEYSDLAYTEDPEKFMENFHMDFLEIGAIKGGIMVKSQAERIDHAIEKIEKGMQNNGVSGCAIGLEAIDLVTGGWQTGLHVIAGRPGTGKTEVGMFMASRAVQSTAAYFAQLEMSEDQSTFRQLTSASGIRYSKMQRSQVSTAELEQIKKWAEKLKNSKLFLDAQSGMSISQIVAKIKYHHKKYGIGIAFVDYVQIMEIDQNKNQTRDQAIGIVTRKLKALANELDIPIILFAQLSRATDSHAFGRPQLTDLRESGNIENDADTVVLLYYAENFRDQYQSFVEDNTGLPLDEIIEFIFAKNRAGTPNLCTFAKWKRGTVYYSDEPMMNPHLFQKQHEDAPY